MECRQRQKDWGRVNKVLLWAIQVSLHCFLFHLCVVVCEFVNDFTVGKALSTILD